jgi:uncharacterized membrane protein YhaH (DUF805 family)
LPYKSQLFWLFFSFSGRVGRAAYFLAGLLLAIVQAFFLYRMLLAQEAGFTDTFWANGFMATFFLSLWSNTALGVKRLHDIGRPGIIAAVLFIPVVSIAAFIALCLMPGDPGPNRYGRHPNSPAGQS